MNSTKEKQVLELYKAFKLEKAAIFGESLTDYTVTAEDKVCAELACKYGESVLRGAAVMAGLMRKHPDKLLPPIVPTPPNGFDARDTYSRA